MTEKTKHNLFVGQVVYKQTYNRFDGFQIREYKISKISRKYFECEGLRDKITISNLRHENATYSQVEYQIYLSKQEIYDKREFELLKGEIQRYFRGFSFPDLNLEKVRKIADILEIKIESEQ